MSKKDDLNTSLNKLSRKLDDIKTKEQLVKFIETIQKHLTKNIAESLINNNLNQFKFSKISLGDNLSFFFNSFLIFFSFKVLSLI